MKPMLVGSFQSRITFRRVRTFFQGRIALLSLLWLSFHSAFGQQSQQEHTALFVTATVQTAQPRITLHIDPPVANFGQPYPHLHVYRKLKGAPDWGTAVADYYYPQNNIPSSWSDQVPQSGDAYDYKIVRYEGGSRYGGYIWAGVEAPLPSTRGKIILVVDKTLAFGLAPELKRLCDDLVGDGYTVLRLDYDRGVTADANRSYRKQVPDLRSAIKNLYYADPQNVKMLLLFGHLAVPYSGNTTYDNHWGPGGHKGAWPADVYFAKVDGNWTDCLVNNTEAGNPWNHNVCDDGKFDQSTLEETGGSIVPQLISGRVDLSNLPAFEPLVEVDLLRRYLDKNHAFRHKLATYQPRALIDVGASAPPTSDHDGVWRSFSAMFGKDEIFSSLCWRVQVGDPPQTVYECLPKNPVVDWSTDLQTSTYLWAYGMGFSGFQYCETVVEVDHFASLTQKAVFTMLYGSWFGDWDNQDNLLRAAIGGSDILTCAYLGFNLNGIHGAAFHHMALGETVGFGVQMTQYTHAMYAGSDTTFPNTGTQTALMGDPTLRLHVVAPPIGVTVSAPESGPVTLTWTGSSEVSHPDFLGYNVYSSKDRLGPFTLVNTGGLISKTQNSYQIADNSATFYMVRGVKLERSPSGTYINASQGALSQNPHLGSPALLPAPDNRFQFTVSAPVGSTAIIEASENLTPTSWIQIGTTDSVPSGGVVTFTDGSAMNYVNRFYRARVGNLRSDNAVGFTKVQFGAGNMMFANTLDNPAGNRLSAFMPSDTPVGTIVQKYDELVGQYVASTHTGNNSWLPDLTLDPGEGAFIQNGGVFTAKFVGEVRQFGLNNPIPTGMTIRSSMVPQQGAVDSVLGYQAAVGDIIYRWNTSSQSYDAYTYLGPPPNAGWGAMPTVNIGESFWISTGGPEMWSRTFLVWP